MAYSSVKNLSANALGGTRYVQNISVKNLAAQVAGSSPPAPVLVKNISVQVSFRADHAPNGGRYNIAATNFAEESDMIYHDLIFPECISYGSTGSPKYVTDKIEVDSGDEQRNQRREYPRHEYSIQMDQLPSAEIADIMNLWHVCSGDFIGFLFLDPMDHTSSNNILNSISGTDITPTDQLVGSAVGSNATYKIYKYYKRGARAKRRRILYPKSGTLRVAIDGKECYNWGYSYSSNELTFTAPLQVTTVNLNKTPSSITGMDFSMLTTGDLLYIDGWSDASYNYPEGGDPVRVVSASSTELVIEKYDGTAYGSAVFSNESVTIKSALPPTGAEITCGYYFYVPVRFEEGDNAESEITSGMRESAHADFSQITLREIFE